MKNIRSVYLIRHGEVENPENIAYGRLPRFGLSKTGMIQAEKLKDFFENKDIDIIISSPLLRSHKTAKIAFPKRKIIKSKFFIEVNYSNWMGKKLSERNPKEVEGWKNDPADVFIGETYEDVLDRTLKGLNRYLKKYPHKNIVIFSHAAPIKFLRAYFKNIQINQIKNLKVTNASISTLKFNDDHFIGESYKEVYPRAEEFY